MIDLHMHSTESDGSFTPTQLIQLCKEKGLSAVALTDHDTTAGVAEAMAAGERSGLRVVPGIEINTEYEGRDVHVTGLFINTSSGVLQTYLQGIQDSRIEKNIKTIKRLNEAGLDITEEDFPELRLGTVMTRGNLARVIVSKGYAANTAEASARYLSKGCPYYVPRKQADPFEAINAIHAAGGKAFIAHFHQIFRKDRDMSEAFCRRFLANGADGLETRYAEFDDELRARADEMAADFHCLRSGGSDFHGAIKPNVMVGTGFGDLLVPDEFLTEIEDSIS